MVSFFSCFSKSVVKKEAVSWKNPNKLYTKAIQKYHTNDWENAVRLFNEFLFRFPEHPRAPEALMKLGEIHEQIGYFAEARKFYEQILSRYSKTHYVSHAQVKILNTFWQEKNYQEIISRSPEIINQPTVYPVKAILIVAEAYLKVDKPEVASKLYTIAYNMAPEKERNFILQSLNKSVYQIPTKELEALVMKIPEKFPKDYFMYQLALKYIEEKKYEQALIILKNFVQKYPHHRLSDEVAQWKNILEKKFREARYTMGILLPLSGRYKVYGHKALAGVELAVEHFASEHPDLPINLKICDTQSDASEADKAVRDFASQGVTAIIGPIATAETAVKIAQIEKIPIITLTLKSNITKCGDYVFRNFLTPEIQIKTLVSFATDQLGLSQFAVLYPDEKYGTVLTNLFWDEVIAQGSTIVAAESYQTDETDYKTSIKKLAKFYDRFPYGYRSKAENSSPKNKNRSVVGFEAIFIPESPVKSSMIIPQLAYHDIKNIYFLGTNLWHSDEFIKMSHYFSKGAIFTDGFFAQSKSAEVQIFVEEFRDTYGKTPGFMEAIAYDTILLVMETLRRNNVLNREDFKDCLMTLRGFCGVTGKTAFDYTGEAIKDAYVIQVKKDGFVELSTPLKDDVPVRIYH
jgi:ABC-type branched-subunit amino acid transport system substrate-binding protein